MNVSVIVFSKDRAAQLDLLMQSLLKYALPLWPPQVLFTASSNEFIDGYRLLREYYPWMKFLHRQENFKRDLIALMDQNAPLTCFGVDDGVFFRPLPPIPDIPLGHAYAPRLGKNCVYCYNRNCAMAEGEYDFDCTYSVDFYVYRTEEILRQIQTSGPFNNPNEMEATLCSGPPFKLLYGDHSCYVNIPNNRVQSTCENRHAGGSAEELNQRFLDGWRIDGDAMDFSNVIGTHQEIPYVWRKT